MKKSMLIKIVLLLIFVVALSACSSEESNVAYGELDSASDEFEYTIISFDTFILEDLEEMADGATHIIRGEVLDQRVEWLNLTIPREVTEQQLAEEGLTEDEIAAELEGVIFEREPEIVTLSRIRVLEIFQGNHYVDDVIEIMQLGGEYGNERWIVDGEVELEVNSELVLFLVSWDMAGLPYSLLSHVQGVYYIPSELEDEYLIEAEDEHLSIELEGINEIDPVTITIEDLIEIAEENDLLDE